MLLLCLARIAEWPSVWGRAVHSVYCACPSWNLINLCVCVGSSFLFCFEGWTSLNSFLISAYLYTSKLERLNSTTSVTSDFTFLLGKKSKFKAKCMTLRIGRHCIGRPKLK